MRRLIPALLLSIFILLVFSLLMVGPSAAQSPDPPAKGSDYTPPTPLPPAQSSPVASSASDRTIPAKIEPVLLKRLLSEPQAPFIVYLKAQTDIKGTVAALQAQGQSDEVATRRSLIAALQQTAQNSQAGVRQTLQESAKTGGLSGQSTATTAINPLWVVNAVAARGSLETVLALAARDDVAIVRLDKTVAIFEPQPPCPAAPPYSCPANPAHFSPLRQMTAWGVGKIRADFVHNALQIDGQGIVVANIDTGVDWQHPALQSKYRGFTGAGHLPQHPGNWYDATGDEANYPIDGNGHGTHTIGTIVGDGIGVAPGAQWIAVKAFNSAGAAQSSWLHQAFQWLLAPNGDPALAPDVVNNSWGSSLNSSLEFEPDIQALLSAGIYPVFSAGNAGPENGTVGAPGSLDITFAVGAVTLDDEVAIFSSRGPSPWGKIKPEVTAPGADILSTFPGGAYLELNGTSMAAPHVSGLAALLLQANPALANNLAAISYAITSTTVPLGPDRPNNDYGWGRIDAYNAVMSVASAGTLEGIVTSAASGQRLDQAVLRITPRGGGPAIISSSDATGFYRQGLAAGRYDVTASAFGYQPVTVLALDIVTGAATGQNFALPLAPVGTLQGTVKESGSGLPLVASLSVDGTPAGTTSQAADGSYSLQLPVGVYDLTVIAPKHRLGRATNITINDGATVTQDFLLAQAPSILLVDSGKWSQDSQIAYYRQALSDNLYNHNLWQITDPAETPASVPTATDLAGYDVVIWSSPQDSPGFVGAGSALADYLKGGGKLLLSGQDVAFFDGGGSIFRIAPYFRDYLKAKYVADDAEIEQISGLAEGPLAGLTLTIAGGDGAGNQFTPDVVGVHDPDFAAPLARYEASPNLAGLQVELCLPYRALYLSFGFEAINARADRSTVLQRAMDWLTASPAPYGVELAPAGDKAIGNFNTIVDHRLRVRNTGSQADLYTLSLNSNWPVNPSLPASLALDGCASQVFTIGVQVATTDWHRSEVLSLTAQSTSQAAINDVATRTTKSPAPLLLVDDDRFISFANQFQQALTSRDIAFDFIQIPKAWTGPAPASPTLETLQLYPMVVWYTGYDWFQPLLPAEEERLQAYLAGGGRLFFSGQDYVYNLPDHTPHAFAQTYLGVQAHIEDLASMTVTGRRGNLVGSHFGPYQLKFPLSYQNNTDILTPTTAAEVVMTGHEGQPIGLMTGATGSGPAPWRTIFLAFGPEVLPDDGHPKMMQRSVGWLSWLGTSQVRPHRSTALAGEVISYTATLTNDGWANISTAYFTATIPAELTLNSYDPALTLANGNLIWRGPLGQGQRVTFSYRGTIAAPLPLGTTLQQTNWLYYPEHNLTFDRLATVYVNFPNLQESALKVSPAQQVVAGDLLTYTLVLKNSGPVDDPQVVASGQLPHMLILQEVGSPSRGSVISDGLKNLTWTTPLSVNEVATLTYRAVISYRTRTPIDHLVQVTDNLTDPLRLRARATYKFYPVYVPIFYKN